MLDSDGTIGKLQGPEIFALTIDGSESLTSMCAALGNLCGLLEAHPGQSVAIVQLVQGDQGATQWPGNITVQDANRWERAVRRLEHCGAIVITTASGRCSGAALDFLLASDYRIATPNFDLRFPVNNGQFWPGMSVHRLVQQVGIARARQIVLWQQSMAAKLCLSIGLVDELDEDLSAATDRMISMVEGRQGSELAVRRRLLLEATSAPYEDALGSHLAACDRELRRIRGTELT